MGGLKVTEIKGIDQASNHLMRKPDSLTDSLNMQKTFDTAWETRPGYDSSLNYTADFAYFSQTHQEQLFFKKTAPHFYRVKNGLVKEISSAIGKFYIPHQNDSTNLGSAMAFNDGANKTVYISYGWYTGAQLATQIQTKLNASASYTFLGKWNATTNIPALIDGTGASNDLYEVSVAGTQNLGSGAITFAAGDYIRYNGTIWVKMLASDLVGFTVTFANGKFTFSRTSAFTFLLGTQVAAGVWPYLGFPLNNVASIVATASGSNFVITSILSNKWSFETLSIAEYQGSIYIASSDNNYPVLKYDGNFVYEAGLLQADYSDAFTGTPAANDDLAEIVSNFSDINSNSIYSPVKIDTQRRSQNFFKSQNFYTINKYVWFLKVGYNVTSYPLTATAQTITETNRTFYGFIDTNMVAGDRVLIRKVSSPYFDAVYLPSIIINEPVNRLYIELEIESLRTGNDGSSFITFTKKSLIGNSVTIGDSSYIMAGWPAASSFPSIPIYLDTSCLVVCPASGIDGVYFITRNLFENQSIIEPIHDNSQTLSDQAVEQTGVSDELEFSRFYSDLTSKIRPPICKYVASFGDQLVFGNISGFYDESNNLTNYNNDDLVMYSDVETGDFGENLSEVNRQLIGEAFDGSITGLKRTNDSMVIFKNSGVFSMDGTLIPGEYSLRKISSNLVGCLSDQSIVDTEEGLLFQASTGIYYTNGLTIQKVSKQLDILFSDKILDLTKTIGSQWRKEEQILFYLSNGKTVVYDYMFKEWTIWNNILASVGIFETASYGLSFYNGSKLFTFNESKKDAGVDIDCYISTAWIDGSHPSLVKKFHWIRFFTFINCNLTITTESDWIEGNLIQELKIASNSTVRMDIDQRNCHSLRFKIGSKEYIKISGFEVEITPNGQRDKN